MADIWFYHLGQQPLETVLPRILAGLQARGNRISVHASTRDVLEGISKSLWTLEDTSFVPHGFSGEPSADTQTLLLCHGVAHFNAPTQQVFIDNTEPEIAASAERISIFFDGNDPAAVDNARTLWKRYSADGHAIKYWKQAENGRWEDQAIKQAA